MSPRADPLEPLMAAVAATMLRLISSIPGGWARLRGGVLGGVSGMPVAMMNGVFVIGAQPRVEIVDELLDEVAQTGLPHSLQLRPTASREIVATAESRGMRLHHETPLMTLRELDAVERTLAECAIELRQIAPAEAPLHVALGAEAFDSTTEIFGTIAGRPVLALPEVSCYVGERDGIAVTTALAILIDDHVAIFNVGTHSDQRGHGYGAAVTSIAVREAFARGAHTAWLQSSPMGLAVYGRLGFRTVESWRAWLSAPV